MKVSFESPEERRNVRIRLYKDDVFLIAQDLVRHQTPTLPMEEIFATADQFAFFLLENDLSEPELIQFEIDDLRVEIPEELSFYLVLTITFVKLCAMRMARANAEPIAYALVGFCQEYECFSDWLRQLNLKEQSRRRFENKRVDLLTYELRCIGNDGPIIDAHQTVASIVAVASEKLTPDGMLPVESVLSEWNEKLGGHPFQKELDKLRENMKKKSEPKIEIAEQHNENCLQNFGKIENSTFTKP